MIIRVKTYSHGVDNPTKITVAIDSYNSSRSEIKGRIFNEIDFVEHEFKDGDQMTSLIKEVFTKVKLPSAGTFNERQNRRVKAYEPKKLKSKKNIRPYLIEKLTITRGELLTVIVFIKLIEENVAHGYILWKERGIRHRFHTLLALKELILNIIKNPDAVENELDINLELELDLEEDLH